MTRNEYRAAALDVLYLAGCAVNGTAPDKKRVEAMDIEALFSVAKSHTMTAITAYSLRKAGLREHEFTQELGKSLQKITLLETEKNRLFRFMEEHGIRVIFYRETITHVGARRFRLRAELGNMFCQDIMNHAYFTAPESGSGLPSLYIKRTNINEIKQHNVSCRPA